MLVLKIYIRASTTACIILQSDSTAFVQLWSFQIGGGNRCLFLNLNPTLIFEKEKSSRAFFPYLKAYQKYFLKGKLSEFLFKSVHGACRAVRGGFLGSLHSSPLYVLPCAGRRRLGLEERFLVAAGVGRVAVQGLGSCPSARPVPAAAEACEVPS